MHAPKKSEYIKQCERLSEGASSSMIDPEKEMKKWEKIPFNRGPREQERERERAETGDV